MLSMSVSGFDPELSLGRLAGCEMAFLPADFTSANPILCIQVLARGALMRFDHLKRREFITLIGGAAAWPLAARAQQAGKPPTVGFLGAEASAWRPWTDAFVERLHALGWIDGRTVAIEYRWDEGRFERDAEIAAEFVRLKVDAIVTPGGRHLPQ